MSPNPGDRRHEATHVLPAEPGWFLIVLYQEADRIEFATCDIIAWAVRTSESWSPEDHWRPWDDLSPITVTEQNVNCAWFVRNPSGVIYEFLGTESWPDVEAFLKHIESEPPGGKVVKPPVFPERRRG